MLIISVRNNGNNKWKRNANKKKKGPKGWHKLSVKVWLCWEFKLGFLHTKCKASLSFQANLELALSIILKEGESWVKAYCGGV